MSIRLGPFELISPLGKGGMGVVWRAVHRAQDKPVAVKVITEKIARDEHYLKSFRDEVAAVARLDHPGVVWLYDFGQVSRRAARDSYGQLVEGSPYLAMEIADRGTLATREIRSWPELLGVLEQLLDALAHAHARGVLHRDLKPANILCFSPLTPDGREVVKLTDFGIAHALDATDTATHDSVMGTLQYMSPEQIRADWREYGPWTDLYALGNLVFKLVAGSLPFAGQGHAELLTSQLYQDAPLLIPRFAVPPGFAGWVGTLLEKSPRARFQRAADAIAALRALSDPAAPTSPDDTLVDITVTQPFSLMGHGGLFGPPAAAVLPADWRGPGQERQHALLGVGRGLFGVRAIPIVGREPERDLLWSALARVHREGDSRAAVVRGDVGVGKTRIIDWLAERAHEVGGATVLRCLCSPTRPPEAALRDMLVRWLHTGRQDPDARRLRVESALRAHGVSDGELHARVAELCDPIEPIDAESRHEELVALLTGLGRHRPILLVVDDAQWGMDALRLALRVLDAGEARVLVVLGVNDELIGDRTVELGLLDELLARPRVDATTVTPLYEDHRTALVEGVLGLAPPLARRVAGRSRGNPLFAVQLIATLVVHELLLPSERGFEIQVPAADAPIELRRAADFPANLGQLWRERLDRLFEELPPGSREALERAAALGLEVELDAWQAVCDDPDGVYAASERVMFIPENARIRHAVLGRLTAERLARETRTGWVFAHGQVRDLLERMARDDGRYARNHLACAAWLRRSGDPADDEPLGLHLLAAGRVDEAIGLLFSAARHRASTVGNRAALGLLVSVEDALIQAGLPKSDPRWGRVWLERSGLYARLGNAEEALRWARRAEASANAFGWVDQPGAAAIYAGIAMIAGDRPEGAREELARGLEAAGEADRRLAALGHAWSAVAAARVGPLTAALEHAQRAEELLEGEVEPGLALAWDEIARSALATGLRPAAARAWLRAAELWGVLGNRLGQREAAAAAAALTG